MVYQAMDWPVPVWAHIPLIHGPDGKKLSKRHGATGVFEYQLMGYPAAGMRNYLTRLGWAHGDAEIFSTEEAQKMFDLSGIGRAPARLDFKKLENTCGHHMAMTEDAALLHELQAFLEASDRPALTEAQSKGLLAAMYCVKERAKTFPDLIEKARFVLESRPVARDAAAEAVLDTVSRGILKKLTPQLQTASWDKATLEQVLNDAAAAAGIGFGKLAQPLRAALAGRTSSPSVFDMMLVLGRHETIARLDEAAG
jgi:glutamyl-tRNA synthetase